MANEWFSTGEGGSNQLPITRAVSSSALRDVFSWSILLPPSSPFLGRIDIIGASASANNNSLRASPAVADGDGLLQSLSVYISGTGTGSVQCVLYDSDGANSGPGTLLDNTNTFSNAVTDAWVTSSAVKGVRIRDGHTYWLAVQFSVGADLVTKGPGGAQDLLTGQTFGSPPASYGTPSSTNTFTLSLYGTVGQNFIQSANTSDSLPRTRVISPALNPTYSLFNIGWCPPSPMPASWTSPTQAADIPGWAGYTVRQLLGDSSLGGPTILKGGPGPVSVTFKAHATNGFTLRNASIGIASGTGGDTVSTPVELLFCGTHGVTVPSSATVTSDIANLSFLASDKLVVIMDFATTPASDTTGASTAGNVTRYKSATASYNSATTPASSTAYANFASVTSVNTQFFPLGFFAGGDPLPHASFMPLPLRDAFTMSLPVLPPETPAVSFSASGDPLPRAPFRPLPLRESFGWGVFSPLIAATPAVSFSASGDPLPRAPFRPLPLRDAFTMSLPVPPAAVTTPAASFSASGDPLPHASFTPLALRDAFTMSLPVPPPPVATPADSFSAFGDPLPHASFTPLALRASFGWGVFVPLPTAVTHASDTGAYLVSGSTANLTYNRKLSAATGVYAVVGSAATLEFSYVHASDTGVYTITGSNATLLLTRLNAGATGSYSTSGSAATLLLTRLNAGSRGQYFLVTSQDGGYRSRKLDAATGVYALIGAPATLQLTRKLDAATGVYALIGAPATLQLTRKLDAATGVYALTGRAAQLVYSHPHASDTGTFAVVGNAAQFVVNYANRGLTGVYQLAGRDATLISSATVVNLAGVQWIANISDAPIWFADIADGG